MYQKPSVPRTVGGVLNDTLQLYKAALPGCLLPALLVSLVTGALSYFMEAALPLTAGQLSTVELLTRYLAVIASFGIWYLVVIALCLVLYGMLVVNVLAVTRGEAPAFGTALATATRRAPALLAASILFILAVAVGFALLIIPGFYVWNRLQLFAVPLLAEQQGPIESLGTSWRAVERNSWSTATVTSVIFGMLLVLEIVVDILTGDVGDIAGGADGLTGDLAAMTAHESVVAMLASGALLVFTAPLVVATLVALYQDLRLRQAAD